MSRRRWLAVGLGVAAIAAIVMGFVVLLHYGNEHRVDWNEVGALAGVVSAALVIITFIGKMILTEVRSIVTITADSRTIAAQNRDTLAAVNRRVTTPDTVPGTLGETVAQVKIDQDEHAASDDARIGMLWRELGKPEPSP